MIDNFDITKEVFVIAELSANHGHDIGIAKESILAAKKAGADAVKVQTYTPDTMTIDSDKEYFKLKNGTIWDGQTLYELYSEAYLPWEWHEELNNYAKSINIIFFSSPFDETAVDLLEDLNVPAYKVASFELLDIPLIEYIASKGKPVIMSTGIAGLSDIEDAVNACRRMGNNQIILLKTTSNYPAKIEDANLLTIPNMKETFDVEVGLSDHTIGETVPIVSAVLGARVIEKHFILDKKIGGPDASFSLEPSEFKKMVESVKNVEKSLGKVDYELTESKMNNRKLGRSLFVVKDIKKGQEFTKDNIRSIRPGDGLLPKYLYDILNKTASKDLDSGTPLSWNVIQ